VNSRGSGCGDRRVTIGTNEIDGSCLTASRETQNPSGGFMMIRGDDPREVEESPQPNFGVHALSDRPLHFQLTDRSRGWMWGSDVSTWLVTLRSLTYIMYSFQGLLVRRDDWIQPSCPALGRSQSAISVQRVPSNSICYSVPAGRAQPSRSA
jgi:hypothetical protein